MTIQDAIARFLIHSRPRSTSRWVRSQERVLGGLAAHLGARRIEGIRPQEVAAWQDRRLGEAARSTVRLEYRVIRQWLRWCRRQGWVAADPCDAVDAPPAPPLREVRYLSRDEYGRLAGACRSPLREMVAVAVYGGLRPGEIRHLHWSAVRADVIELRAMDGWAPKRGRERRIPLHPDLAAMLAAWRASDGLSPLVFHTRRLTAYVQQDMLRMLQAAGQRAGLDPPPDWRTLRHTFASWLAMAGVSIFHIARFLGHSSVQTTERHYAGLRPEVLRDQIERLGPMDAVHA